MFDDSKRLDRLEAQMKALLDSYGKSVKLIDANTKALSDGLDQINKRVEKLEKRLDAAIEAVNKHVEVYRKADSTHEATLAKLQQRCANLEVAVKKLK